MKKYKIVTDSSANLTREIIEQFDIEVISLSFFINGKEYSATGEEEEENVKAFYENLRRNENVSTSCANVNAYREKFEKLVKEGFDILYIGFSSALSSTYNSACIAAKEVLLNHPDSQIKTVDSLLASMGEGLLVYEAILKKEEGVSINELYDFVNAIKMNVNSYFTVDTLTYLARGGRISKLASTVGTMIDVKPILNVDDNGRLVSNGKVMGRKRSIFTLADKVSKNILEGENQTIFISHGDCIEDAKLLAERIAEKVKIKNFVFNYVDPVIGTHSGPNTLAVFFFGISRISSNAYSVNNLPIKNSI